MEDRRLVNPKVLLLVGAVVLVVSSAIAIFMAVSYSPRTTTTPSPVPSMTTTPSTR
jgi:hypothetical protein